ncbi:hypothetical protein SBBP2_340002 [Burkholderiales bacterium]|nr:hypothetical protein SBBP2_340002 [Burkholderiales bacterium]
MPGWTHRGPRIHPPPGCGDGCCHARRGHRGARTPVPPSARAQLHRNAGRQARSRGGRARLRPARAHRGDGISRCALGPSWRLSQCHRLFGRENRGVPRARARLCRHIDAGRRGAGGFHRCLAPVARLDCGRDRIGRQDDRRCLLARALYCGDVNRAGGDRGRNALSTSTVGGFGQYDNNLCKSEPYLASMDRYQSPNTIARLDVRDNSDLG